MSTAFTAKELLTLSLALSHFHMLLCLSAHTQFLIRALIPRSASRLQAAVTSRVTGTAALQRFRQLDRGLRSIAHWRADADEQLGLHDADVEVCSSDEQVKCVCCIQ
jgi:hypothetical protein